MLLIPTFILCLIISGLLFSFYMLYRNSRVYKFQMRLLKKVSMFTQKEHFPLILDSIEIYGDKILEKFLELNRELKTYKRPKLDEELVKE
jgi:hypothetical protein